MDLFRKLIDKGNGHLQVTAEDLERLIKHAHDERQTLQALLASAASHTTEIPQVNASLDEAGRSAAALTQQLEDLAGRVGDLESIHRQVQMLETRVATLDGGVRKAEERVQQTSLAREAQIQEHQAAVQQLVSLERGTLAQIDGLKQERAALTQLEERLPRLRTELQPLFDQHVALKTDLDLLRGGVAALAHDAETGREASLKARAHAAKATEVVADFQRKLEPLAQLSTLSQDTEAQLRSLNALAEHVSVKVKALESQQSVVEHALVESRRVHEMVWEMDVQIKKLNEGSQRATRVEETLAKLERVQAEAMAQVDEAARVREAFGHEVTRQERDVRGLIEVIQGHVDHLAVNKQELETVHERLRVAQTGIAAAEARVEALSAQEQGLGQLGVRIESLATGLQELTAQADTLQRKQAALSSLEERLDGLEMLAKRTQWQFDGLAEHRKGLDTLKAEIQAVQTTYEQTATLVDKLRADKREVEQFLDTAGGFMGQASQIEAKIDALAAQITEAETSAGRAAGMADAVEDLATKLAVIAPRAEIVEDLEGRLNVLNALSADVDRRLSDQLARRAEVENLNVLCDGVAAHVTDAQQKLTAVNAAQARLEPAMAQISALQADLAQARAALQALKQDEDTLAAQERRFADLAEGSRMVSLDIAQRLETVQGLQAELGKAGALKEQLLGELGQIQSQERDTFAHLEAAEDQFKRLDTLWKKLEQRRSQLEETQHTMARVEDRMEELRRRSDDVEQKIQAIAGREQIVEAVRRGVEGVHALGLKSQADLAAIGERRAEIAQAKNELDRLRDSLAGTQEKIVAIESRRQLVDDVQRKADSIAHILGDVHITLDSVSEQKAMVDHVFAELARLEYLVQEARGTMKALQAERDVAQRIVENVRQIHARAASEERKSA
jgi:chromosome segregation ATPase